MIIRTLLVGMFSHQGASAILANLANNTRLTLVPEPENPYDSGAIRVEVRPADIPESRHGELTMLLPGAGMTLEELLACESWPIGHVAKTGGRPLERAGLTAGNTEVHAAMTLGSVKATLFFWSSGQPGVEVVSGE